MINTVPYLDVVYNRSVFTIDNHSKKCSVLFIIHFRFIHKRGGAFNTLICSISKPRVFFVSIKVETNYIPDTLNIHGGLTVKIKQSDLF